MISFIIPCKGRLTHLRKTLPLIVPQPDSECVLVDYSCPEKCGKWVGLWHPEVKMVSVPGKRWFNLSEARNEGAKAASGEWLCFLDADVLLDKDFVKNVIPLLDGGKFLALNSGYGAITLCRKHDFERTGGFDESLLGYGFQTEAFQESLRGLGIAMVPIPPMLARHERHEDAVRSMHHEDEDIVRSRKLNALKVAKGKHLSFRSSIPIVGFLHVAMMGHWRAITHELVGDMRSSGLLAETERIHVGVLGEGEFDPGWFGADFARKCRVSRNPDLRRNEYHTLDILRNQCEEGDFKLWYAHTKGASRPDDEHYRNWRAMLSHVVLKGFRHCLLALDDFDACGPNLMQNDRGEQRFDGDFFWANSGYVRTLPRVGGLEWGDRFDAENWLLRSPSPSPVCLLSVLHETPPGDLPDVHYVIPRPRRTSARRPTFCVVTPTIPGRETQLLYAIASVHLQDHDDYIHVVCGDGPAPMAEELCRKEGVTWASIPKAGRWGHACRNHVIENFDAEHYLFLDDDNYLFPNCLSTLARNLGEPFLVFNILYERDKGQDKVVMPGKPSIEAHHFDSLNMCVRADVAKKARWDDTSLHDYNYAMECLGLAGQRMGYIKDILGEHACRPIPVSSFPEAIVLHGNGKSGGRTLGEIKAQMLRDRPRIEVDPMISVITWNSLGSKGMLEETLEACGVPLVVLGKGTGKWEPGFFQKIGLSLEELRRTKAEYVLAIDDHDALLVSSPNPLIGMLDEMKCEMLFNRDVNPWPPGCPSREAEDKIGDGYLNSGAWFGKTKAAIEAMERADRIIRESGVKDDQYALRIAYVEMHPRIKIDAEGMALRSLLPGLAEGRPVANVIDPAQPHLGGNIVGGDPDSRLESLWSWMMDKLGTRSVFDVGCAEGNALRFFRKRGCLASGLDGLQQNVDLCDGMAVRHDLTIGPYHLPHPVDLVWCCEVAEHVEEKYLSFLLETLCQGKYLAMTASNSLHGYHHVNCKPSEYWIEHMAARGYRLMVEETRETRHATGGYWYLSGLLFERIE